MDSSINPVELYLLSYMRSAKHVRGVLEGLGLDAAAAVAHGRAWSSQKGFGTLAHPVTLYRDYLGEPAIETLSSEGDVARRYRLETWPDLELEVVGSREGLFRDLQLVPRSGVAGVRLPAHQLVTWSTTLADIEHLQAALEDAEWWYPVRDFYYSPVGEPPGFPVYLAFNFGLLQYVGPVEMAPLVLPEY